MRRRFVLYFEKKNVGFGLGSRFLLNFYFGFSFKIMIFFFFSEEPNVAYWVSNTM